MIRDSEREVFSKIQPHLSTFAGCAMSCEEGPDPPDFLCTDSQGQRVGVELAEWLNEKQVKSSKQRQRRRQGHASLASSLSASPENIGRLTLFPLHEISDGELPKALGELETLLADLDSRWLALAEHHSPQQGIPVREFAGYPLLRKRLAQIDLYPRTSEVFAVSVFEGGGGAYSPRSAFSALTRILGKKECKYDSLHDDADLEKLFLVLYWWQGHAHNSPYDVPDYGFSEIATDLERHIRTADTVFDKVFLFDMTNGSASCAWDSGA